MYGLADAPARLKKELDTVLVLQGDLDAVDRTIERTKATIKKSVPGSESSVMIDSLERTHERLKDKVEALYASLNVHSSFPELANVDLEFVRTLLMARDLKINIRKRAVGSFFEWERLDQAVGGRAQTLGRSGTLYVNLYLLLSRHETPSIYAKGDLQTQTRPSRSHPQIQPILRKARNPS